MTGSNGVDIETYLYVIELLYEARQWIKGDYVAAHTPYEEVEQLMAEIDDLLRDEGYDV